MKDSQSLNHFHNEFEVFYGYFDVEIPEEEPVTIILDVTNKKSKTKTYIKFGD